MHSESVCKDLQEMINVILFLSSVCYSEMSCTPATVLTLKLPAAQLFPAASSLYSSFRCWRMEIMVGMAFATDDTSDDCHSICRWGIWYETGGKPALLLVASATTNSTSCIEITQNTTRFHHRTMLNFAYCITRQASPMKSCSSPMAALSWILKNYCPPPCQRLAWSRMLLGNRMINRPAAPSISLSFWPNTGTEFFKPILRISGTWDSTSMDNTLLHPPI